MNKFDSWLRDSTKKLLDNDVVVINQHLSFSQADLIDQAFLILTNSKDLDPSVNILALAADQLLDRHAVEAINFNNQTLQDEAMIDDYQFHQSVA